MSLPGRKRDGPRLVLLLEDQQRTRQWMTGIVRRAFPDAEVIGVARLQEALNELARLEQEGRQGDLGLVLIDINVPDGNGLDLVRELASRWPDASPIVATIYDDDAHLMEAMAAGARGYLLKSDDADVLVRHLHRIEGGELPLSPSIAHRILAYFREAAIAASPGTSAPHQASLSPRETEVLGLLGRGLTVAEAAERLDLSAQTVAGYVKAIYSKLDVSNRAQAALEARRRGLA